MFFFRSNIDWLTLWKKWKISWWFSWRKNKQTDQQSSWTATKIFYRNMKTFCFSGFASSPSEIWENPFLEKIWDRFKFGARMFHFSKQKKSFHSGFFSQLFWAPKVPFLPLKFPFLFLGLESLIFQNKENIFCDKILENIFFLRKYKKHFQSKLF